MDWQQITSLAIVGFTAVLLVRSEIRKRRRGAMSECGTDCGCSTEVHGHRPTQQATSHGASLHDSSQTG